MHIYRTEENIMSKNIAEEIYSWNTSTEKELYASLYYYYVCNFIKGSNSILAAGKQDLVTLFKNLVQKNFLHGFELLEKIVQKGIANGKLESSNSGVFICHITGIIYNFINEEEFIPEKGKYKLLCKSYSNNEPVFNLIIEFSFKALAPRDKKLEIPVLTSDEIDKLDQYFT